MNEILGGYLLTLVKVLAAALIFGCVMPIMIWLIGGASGRLDVWKELKGNNIALAIVLAASVIAFALIVGTVI